LIAAAAEDGDEEVFALFSKFQTNRLHVEAAVGIESIRHVQLESMLLALDLTDRTVIVKKKLF
jgi:hypothetical protein